VTNNTSLTILSTAIRQDAQGRYCLNDCHRAAGGDNAKRPSLWAENAQTKALIVELEGSAGNPAHPFNVVTAGPNEGRGTYGSEEVLLAYAQWISPAFHVQCLRALLSLMKGEIPSARTKRIRKPGVTAIFKSRFAIGRLIGLDENQAAIAAGRACEKKCGENPLPDMGLTYLEAPTQQRTMTATQIAEALNLPGKQPGMAGNNLMAAAGLQTFHRDKRNKKVWTPTEAGMPFARLCDVGKGHSDGSVPTYQWLPSVLEPLRLHLATTVEAPPFTKNPEPVS